LIKRTKNQDSNDASFAALAFARQIGHHHRAAFCCPAVARSCPYFCNNLNAFSRHTGFHVLPIFIQKQIAVEEKK
jgi:hypothetical protein